MRLCLFGAYDPHYPRHTIIRKGLVMNKVRISECWLPPKYKFWLRYPLFLFSYPIFCKGNDFFFVPEFCQKDVPLAKFLSLLFSSSLVFDPLASRYETKITDWRRKSENSWQAWWNYKIDHLAFKLSDLVLADTHAHKDYYCHRYGLPADKVAVLPVGYDDTLFRPTKTESRNDHFTVLFFGSFLPLHGAEVMVRAAKIVSSKEASIQFRFVGSGQTLSQVKALALEIGCSNIIFEGWIHQEELPQKIASADVCLGIFGRTDKARRVVPHKIFQAMGMRKPVITAQTPAVREFFSHRNNIYLCPEPFHESLAQAILELKKDEILKDNIAEKGFNLAREKFVPAAIGRDLKRILDQSFSSSSRR